MGSPCASPSLAIAYQGDNSDDKARMMSDGGGNNGTETIIKLCAETTKGEDRDDDQ